MCDSDAFIPWVFDTRAVDCNAYVGESTVEHLLVVCLTLYPSLKDFPLAADVEGEIFSRFAVLIASYLNKVPGGLVIFILMSIVLVFNHVR